LLITAYSQSVHCASTSLLQITVVRTEVERAGFITNEFQIRDI
jgi:hypothetical protein